MDLTSLKNLFQKKESAEKHTEKVALRTPIKITLGTKEIEVERPTLATWIAFSTIASRLSDIGDETDNSYASLVRMTAHDGELFAKMLSLFILTARAKEKDIEQKSNELSHQYTAEDIAFAIYLILEEVNITGLFMLTASLKSLNMTKATVGQAVETPSSQR